MNDGEKPILERSYRIPLSMFQAAFRTFQKKFVFPKNYVLTVILGIICGVYIESAIHDTENVLAYFLIFVCLAMIFILWYNPRKLRKSLFSSLQEIENDVYHFRLFADGMTIATEEAPPSVSETSVDIAEELPIDESMDTREITNQSEGSDGDNGFHQLFEEKEIAAPLDETKISFAHGVKIVEQDDYFMVYLVKHMFYVLPKKDFSSDELEQLRKIFREQLNA